MYPSDMTDEQWEVVQKHFPAGKRAGRPRGRSARDMINHQRHLLCVSYGLPVA